MADQAEDCGREAWMDPGQADAPQGRRLGGRFGAWWRWEVGSAVKWGALPCRVLFPPRRMTYAGGFSAARLLANRHQRNNIKPRSCLRG